MKNEYIFCWVFLLSFILYFAWECFNDYKQSKNEQF